MGVLHRWQSPAAGESVGVLPQPKDPPTTLVVVWAFDKSEDDGELVPAFDPREMPDERRAVAAARMLSLTHTGVIAWKRSVRPDRGEFGEPEILFQAGEVPDLD